LSAPEERKFKVLLDEGAPVPVAAPFLSRGHEVIYYSDVLEPGAKDSVVCYTAIINKAILIVIDRDVKQLARRFGAPDKNNKFPQLNLIYVCCNEVLAAKRLAHAMSFIENEWNITCEKVARRLWVDIGPHYLRSNR
jgi:predicted nuclease of predicted toxin-antitoxin system